MKTCSYCPSKYTYYHHSERREQDHLVQVDQDWSDTTLSHWSRHTNPHRCSSRHYQHHLSVIFRVNANSLTWSSAAWSHLCCRDMRVLAINALHALVDLKLSTRSKSVANIVLQMTLPSVLITTFSLSIMTCSELALTLPPLPLDHLYFPRLSRSLSLPSSCNTHRTVSGQPQVLEAQRNLPPTANSVL